jgi:hypothetical protein
LKLQPLSFGSLIEMLPNYDSEQRVAVYTITGGVPAYVNLFSYCWANANGDGVMWRGM